MVRRGSKGTLVVVYDGGNQGRETHGGCGDEGGREQEDVTRAQFSTVRVCTGARRPRASSGCYSVIVRCKSRTHGVAVVEERGRARYFFEAYDVVLLAVPAVPLPPSPVLLRMKPSLARLSPHLPLPTPLLPSQRAQLHLPSHPRSLPTRSATPRASRSLATSSSSTPPKRRTLIDLGLIGVAGVGVSGALLYQRSQDAESASGGGMGEGDRPAFTVPVQ